jgi:hypothetical protein
MAAVVVVEAATAAAVDAAVAEIVEIAETAGKRAFPIQERRFYFWRRLSSVGTAVFLSEQSCFALVRRHALQILGREGSLPARSSSGRLSS